jgi:hypothetical protein
MNGSARPARGNRAAEIASLRSRLEVFGLVASDPTVSREIDDLAQAGSDALTGIRPARASAHAWVWRRARGPTQDGRIVLARDTTLLVSHSEKVDAAKTWTENSGFHPLLVFCDHGESGAGEPPVAGLFRRGNASSNTATDHLTVLDDALTQLPADLRQPDKNGKVRVLVRTDAADATHAFTARINQLACSSPLRASAPFRHPDRTASDPEESVDTG